MRVTVSIDDEIGREVEQAAQEEGISVSAYYARAAEELLKRRRRQQAARALLDAEGTIEYKGDIQADLDEMRQDDPNRP